MVYTPSGAFGRRQDELMKQVSLSRITYLLTLPPDHLIRLYSYQDKAGYEAALQRGYWTGEEHHIFEGDGAHEFVSSYQWMREKMQERIPGYSGEYPIWCWIKRPSTKPKQAKYQGTSGQIRLTCLIPRKRIVFSDFDAWHHVLNQSLICDTEEEWDQHCDQYPDHPSYLNDQDRQVYYNSIKPSWDKCLDFKYIVNTNWNDNAGYFRVQACVDRIYPHDIVAIRHFDKERHKR